MSKLENTMTVKDLKEVLDTYEDDVPVCGLYDGRKPLIAVIPSLGSVEDVVKIATLQLGSLEDYIEVDFDTP